jgi:hypothetical protein
MTLKDREYKIPTRLNRNQICIKYNILKEQKKNEIFEDTVKRLLKENETVKIQEIKKS